MVEEDTRAVFEDGVECAARVVGDDGAGAGLGFDGGDAEVLGLGEQEGCGSAVLIAELLVVDSTKEGDGLGVRVFACGAFGVGEEGFFVRAGADDFERAVGEQGGVDGEVYALVGFECADEEEVPGAFNSGVRGEEVCADGRVDDD